MNKSKLQELCHQYSWGLPEYKSVKDGPDHNPRFTATVTVNGVTFQTPPDQCRSSKEAQNQAAMLALAHFTAPKTLLQHPQPISAPLPNASRPSSSSDVPHVFKNQLQNYAQKGNLALPMYSYEFNGPPHARRFKSKVTIDGNTYETPEFFPTLKEAEHAAAKVAFESLSPDDVQEDEGLYKSLLQELAHKRGFHFPAYETTKSGSTHMPIFVSTVQIGDESFQGQEAKTKKQAEMNAAKAAYAGLTDGRARRNGTALSPGCLIMGTSKVSSSFLQSTVTNELQPNITPNTDEINHNIGAKVNLSTEKEQAVKDKGHAKENHTVLSPISFNVGALDVPFSSLQLNVSDELQPNILPNVTDEMRLNVGRKNNLVVKEEQSEKDQDTDFNGKRHTCSSPYVSPSLPSEYSTNYVMESDISITTPAGPRTVAGKKIIVRPHEPNLTYTDGAIVASDDKWVAMRVNMDRRSQ